MPNIITLVGSIVVAFFLCLFLSWFGFLFVVIVAFIYFYVEEGKQENKSNHDLY